MIPKHSDVELTPLDNRTIGKCLTATVSGPFFPNWEFQHLFAYEREEVALLVRDWPNVDTEDFDVQMVVASALGQLAGYPHGLEDTLQTDTGASQKELLELMHKWREFTKLSE